MRVVDTEKSIRQIVRSCVEGYASGFETRHIKEKDNPNGTINMKIHNVFISALGEELQYYTSLVRSLDSSMGNMLEKMAINIAKLFYEVQVYSEQTVKMFDKQTSTYHLIKLREEEALIGKDLWNLVCCSEKGYKIVIDEYKKSVYSITNTLKDTFNNQAFYEASHKVLQKVS